MIKGSDTLFGSDDHCVVVIFITCYVVVVIIVLLQYKLKCNFINESNTIIGGIYSTNLGKRVYIKTHFNNPFSAKGYANYNEHYTSHDPSISGGNIS